MFDHLDGSFRAFAKNNIRWTEDLVSAMKFGWQKRLKNYASVTPMTGMRLIKARIFNPFRKLWLFRKWDKGMDNHPQDKTFYITR